jgi:glutathione S-transferase
MDRPGRRGTEDRSMKLYYSPSACSLSPHIALREAGAAFDLVKVDLASKKTETGEDYLAINPKGQVPALVTDDGEVITEGPVILQYLAETFPAAGLAPAEGRERRRFLEWLNFATSEMHKGLGGLFNRQLPEEAKPVLKAAVARKLGYLDQHLGKNQHALGERFSAVDGYLFTVLRWTKPLGVDLSPYANIRAFMERVAERPKVREALAAEGLA